MKKDAINLADALVLIKKNFKSFYLFIAAGVVIGFISIFVNINYIEKKIILSSKISIKNPLQNYLILDLFSLDTIQIKEDNISVTSTQEKILNYYTIAREYMELVFSNVDYDKYNLNDEKYDNIKVEKIENEYILTIKNVSDPKRVENNLKSMVNDFNKIISPIILKNVSTEIAHLENFLELSGQNSTDKNKKLSILIEFKKNNVENLENINFEIFEISINKNIDEISNLKLFMVSILMTLILFLLFIIIRK